MPAHELPTIWRWIAFPYILLGGLLHCFSILVLPPSWRSLTYTRHAWRILLKLALILYLVILN
ncbi:hypothetical protein CC80DRAFT_229637 [Byssothecium circinans]|uniref:Uncharacterized protein n=1 Tax=Byssothecium circinans TaxID=147558 RepID=A0A6A5UJ30_9PLEO|nr:hypothetical protein CC80DRAFT_229637 [Byssothecium circinans]